MLKILQARLQQYVNCKLPDVQAGFRKGRGTRDQIANSESEWTLGNGDGQGGLVCCDPWGRKESDTNEQLNWLNNSKFLGQILILYRSEELNFFFLFDE